MIGTVLKRRGLRYWMAGLGHMAIMMAAPALAQNAIDAVPSATGLTPVEVERVDAAMRKLVEAGIPGIALAVARDGAVVYAQGYGVMNIASARPVTATTRMEVGSVTKQFTAAAILQLVEAGKLTLDDPLGKYIPEYTRARAVTLRELLWQVTGIPDYVSNNPVGLAKTVGKKADFDYIVGTIKNRKFDFPTGTRWAYSNANYFLLGRVIEIVSGLSYASYIKQKLFEPAGMTRSTTIADENSLDDMATGYWKPKGKLEAAPATPDLWAGAAGNLVSDVGDLMKWDDALLRGKIVNAADLALMMSAGHLRDGEATSYGMGWVVGDLYNQKLIWHNGGTLGFGAMNAIFPEEKLRLVALVNDSAAKPELITAKVFAALYPEIMAQKYTPAAGECPAMTARARTYIAQLLQGHLDRSRISPELSAHFSPKHLNEVRQALSSFGTLAEVIFKGMSTASNLTAYAYVARFPDSDLTFTLSFDTKGRLAKIDGKN
jgi:D-alanyl-D-alanine carboxypeptidase